MTFKEFKKQYKLNSTAGFCLSYDWDIYCDMAERAGFDPTDLKIADYYGDHQVYLEEHNIDLWHENICIQDEDFTKLEQLSDEAFLREYFFDNYEVVDSYYDNDYGFVVKLTHE